MSKAADMAKVSAKGGFHLLLGLVASTLISSAGTIFIARLLGSDNYGLYAIVLTVPNLVSIFRDWGVNTAMTRYSAQFRAENRGDEIRSIVVSGLIFELVLGLVLTVLSVLLAGFLATDVFHRPVIAPLIQIASFSVLANGLMAATLSVFTGLERMELTSIVWVVQAVIKTASVVGLVILGFGTAGAAIGFTAGAVFAGAASLVIMGVLYRKLPKPVSLRLEIKAYLGTMLSYGVPFSLAGIIGGFLMQFYMILLPMFYVTDNVMIGNYGVAQNFVVLITFFATPITTLLFPAFSKLDRVHDGETLRNVFQYSVRYAALFVVPVAALVMCLAGPAVSTLFGSTYESAPLFLALLAISYLYTAFGNLSAANLINSQGETKVYLYLTLLTASIGFPMGYLLIMNFGVLGLIATSLTAGVPSLVVNLRYIHQKYGVSVDWLSSAKILFSSALTAISTYLIVSEFAFASYVKLFLGVVVFVLILVPVLLVTRTVTVDDVDNLRGMTSGLGAIGGLFGSVLGLLRRLMVALRL